MNIWSELHRILGELSQHSDQDCPSSHVAHSRKYWLRCVLSTVKKKKHPFGFCGLLCLHMTIIRLHIREQLWALTCSSVDSNVWGFSAQENIFNIALLLLLLLYSLLTSPNNPTDLTAFQSKVSKCLVKKPLKSLSSFKVKPMWEKWAAFLAGQLNKYNDVTSQEEDRQKKF